MQDKERKIETNGKIIGKITNHFFDTTKKYKCLIFVDTESIFEYVPGYCGDIEEINNDPETEIIDYIAKLEDKSLVHYRITPSSINKSYAPFTSYIKVNKDLFVIENKRKQALYSAKKLRTLSTYFSQLTIISDSKFFFIDEINHVINKITLHGNINENGVYTNVYDANRDISYGNMSKQEYEVLRKSLTSKYVLFNRPKLKQKRIIKN